MGNGPGLMENGCGFEVPVTGLNCLGFASYGVAGTEPGEQGSTGALHLNGFESSSDTEKKKTSSKWMRFLFLVDTY